MSKYIATFFSHYDALTFFAYVKEQGIQAKLAPVPRKVSASCGTCVIFETDAQIDFKDHELEAVYRQTDSGFVIITAL